MCYLHRGARIGSRKQYEVEAWLGFSETKPDWELFAARNVEDGDAVLVKAFPEDGSAVTASFRSFEHEARRVAELVHPRSHRFSTTEPSTRFGRVLCSSSSRVARPEPIFIGCSLPGPGPLRLNH